MDRRHFLSAWGSTAIVGLSGCGGGESAADPPAPAATAPPPDTAPAPSPATPVVAPPAAPQIDPASWLPPPGEFVVVTALNSWKDIDPCPANDCGYRVGSGSEWSKVIDDYSGGVYNPHWGALGALMMHGGGHSATNDNSVGVLDFNDLRYKRVADPSLDVTGIGPADGPVYPGYDRDHGEYVSDGKPGSAHTYDALAVIPPEVSGAAFGALVRPFSSAIHFNLSRGTGWAHKLDLNTRAVETAQGRAMNSWSRWSENGDQGFTGAGGCCAYDGLRRRIWWIGVPSQHLGRIVYLDCTTRRHASIRYGGSDALFDVSVPVMHYLAQRDLIVAIGRRHGDTTIDVQYFRPDSPTGWTRAVLTAAIPTGAGYGATPWTWVPELDRIVLFAPADGAAMHELDVPADPTRAWTLTRRPFPSGASITRHARVIGKRFAWSAALGCIVYKPLAAVPSLSQFYAYRPPGL